MPACMSVHSSHAGQASALLHHWQPMSCTGRRRGALSTARGVHGADNVWYRGLKSEHGFHPSPAAPQCVPCNYPEERLNRLPLPKARGCPCTPAAICAADATGTLSKPPRPCGMPRYHAPTVWRYYQCADGRVHFNFCSMSWWMWPCQ